MGKSNALAGGIFKIFPSRCDENKPVEISKTCKTYEGSSQNKKFMSQQKLHLQLNAAKQMPSIFLVRNGLDATGKTHFSQGLRP